MDRWIDSTISSNRSEEKRTVIAKSVSNSNDNGRGNRITHHNRRGI